MRDHNYSQAGLISGVIVAMIAFMSTNLFAASCLSGYVRDGNGNPVVNVDLDFFDIATGSKLVTPRDNTDATGFYNVCVLPGTYRVTYAPRRGSHLMGAEIASLDFVNNQSLTQDIVLETGLVVSGQLTDSLGAPIGDIDLDFDRLGGGRVYTGDDNSLPVDGSFWVVVPPDSYRLRFDPPLGSIWRGLQIDTFVVTKDTVFNAVLHRGFSMSGTVRDELGADLAEVDIELKDVATGEDVFIANNSTDVNGLYHVAVPPGIFDLRFVPVIGNPLIGSEVKAFTIDGDTTWDATLGTGIVVTVNVTDQSDRPLKDIDLDFNIPLTGDKLFTPHDKTDSNGVSISAITPGIYHLELDPPVGAPFDRLTIRDVNCRVDTTVTLRMPEVTRVRLAGQVRSEAGLGIARVSLELRNAVTGSKAFLQDNLTDQAGFYDIAVPTGIFDLYLQPAIDERYVAAIVSNVRIEGDTTLPQLTLRAGYQVRCRVLDPDSLPIDGADIDVTFSGSNEILFTPYDKTDADGIASLMLTAGTFNFKAIPPSGSELIPALASEINVSADSSLVLMLTRTVSDAEEVVEVLPNFPNPFSTTTTIRYSLVESARTVVKLYTVAGELVRTLQDGSEPAGDHEISWDGRNSHNQEVSNGVYVCLIQANDSAHLIKIVRIQ